MADNPVVQGFLQVALEDLDAARRLLAPPANRLACYHLHQAAEKLAKAILSARGIHTTKEHRLSLLAPLLSNEDPWRGRLASLAHLDRYATTFRYPGTSGRLPTGADAATVQAEVDRLAPLLAEARRGIPALTQGGAGTP